MPHSGWNEDLNIYRRIDVRTLGSFRIREVNVYLFLIVLRAFALAFKIKILGFTRRYPESS